MNLLDRWWRAVDWRTAWKTPAPDVDCLPAHPDQARLEVWQFARDPNLRPTRPWVSLEARKLLGERVSTRSMAAFFNDQSAAQIEVLTSSGFGGHVSFKEAWSAEQARKAALMIMAEAPRGMDVWVLEHTTQASGVRVHHVSGSWTLFPNSPVRVSSSPMLAQAGRWLWAVKRRELAKRPALSALRQSLAQGPDALDRALTSMAWDWSAVMEVIDAIDAITHPVEPYFATDSPWYSSAPEQQKAWLGTEGTFEGFHQWKENPSLAWAIDRLCRSIPAAWVPSEADLECPEGELEPWDGFSRILELLPYWIIPRFWVLHRDPMLLWTDPRAAEYWGSAFGLDHFQVGDPALAAMLADFPHGHEDSAPSPWVSAGNPHGCVDFIGVPLDMFHQEWGKRLLPLLPRSLQHRALDEALVRIRPAARRRLVDLSDEEQAHLQWLQATVPDWEGWPRALRALGDYPAYRAELVQQALDRRLATGTSMDNPVRARL